MKSGVAFWESLVAIREIHPCWAHLQGVPLVEADLPRPISNQYKSVFDLPTPHSSNTSQEQSQAEAKTDALPRVTTLVSAATPSSAHDEATQAIKLNASSFAAGSGVAA